MGARGRGGAPAQADDGGGGGARENNAQRCLMSVYVSVLVCVAMLVAVSITAVWVPSAVLAN